MAIGAGGLDRGEAFLFGFGQAKLSTGFFSYPLSRNKRRPRRGWDAKAGSGATRNGGDTGKGQPPGQPVPSGPYLSHRFAVRAWKFFSKYSPGAPVSPRLLPVPFTSAAPTRAVPGSRGGRKLGSLKGRAFHAKHAWKAAEPSCSSLFLGSGLFYLFNLF